MNKNIKNFTELVKQEILRQLPKRDREEVTLHNVENVKINDQKLHGIQFERADSNTSPVFYLDEEFAAYQYGAPLEEFAKDVVQTYLGQVSQTIEPDIKRSTAAPAFHNLEDKLCLRLVEIKRNQEYLLDKPYFDVGNGLALLCDITGGSKDTPWRAVVDNRIMESNGYDKDKLFQTAVRSAANVDPPVMMSLLDCIFSGGNGKDLLPNSCELPANAPGYIITCRSKRYGAAALFYPGVMERAAEILGEGYAVIPSSLHEVILIPDSRNTPVKELQSMISDGNKTVVTPAEVLSDNVYAYDRQRKRLSVISEG